MFINIGDDNVIQSEDVISIIDYSVVTTSGTMAKMVKNNSQQQQVFGPDDEVKSIVVTRKETFYSSLSVPTLKRRASMVSKIGKLDDFSDEIE